MNLNGLEKYFETDRNGEIIDFQQMNEDRRSPLMYALFFNQSKNLNLSHSHFEYLIKNSDLRQVNKYGNSPLMLALRNNKEENLNLSEKQWDYLIKNSDLKQVNPYDFSPLIIALMNNKTQNLNLSKEQWKYMIDNSDVSLIRNKEKLIKLKKIQSELLNEKILSKIDIKEEILKKLKV